MFNTHFIGSKYLLFLLGGNQTFQLSPNQGGIRYANTIEDVNKEIVFNDTAFFSNDMSVLWVKNASGDVKSYELKEIIEKDEKDVQIES